MRLLLIQMMLLLTVASNKCSCSKENIPPKPTYSFSQEFKDYNLFQNGSKWIYQKENSQDKDTVQQEYLNYRTFDNESRCYCVYEDYFSRQKSSFFNDFALQRGKSKISTENEQFANFYDFVNMSYETTYVNSVTLIFF